MSCEARRSSTLCRKRSEGRGIIYSVDGGAATNNIRAIVENEDDEVRCGWAASLAAPPLAGDEVCR